MMYDTLIIIPFEPGGLIYLFIVNRRYFVCFADAGQRTRIIRYLLYALRVLIVKNI